RLFFRGEYGETKLRFPLFGDEGVDEFDKIDLRTSQNNSWSFQGSSQNTLIRDVFSRDVQRDMGQPYTRSRYYHLYINGHYWGIYQTQERADADFAESYLGGDKDEYDVIKNDSSGSRVLHATDGTMDAYRRLYDAAVAGFTSDAAYLAVQGLRPDGTPDPNGERLLDPENLMDYMICTYYTGDPDAPVSCWAHFSNNVFAIYNRVQPQGFTWYRHDAEHSLGANGGLDEGRLLTDPTDRSIGQEWQHFNPAWLHLQLTAHPEYLMHFADRVHKYFWNDGLLTAAPNIQRWMTRADQIDLAIIAESARWGDAQRHPPRTKDDWEGQNNYMVNTFFPGRTQIVINQMRSVNMFPDLTPVSFNQHGGPVSSGFDLTMSAPTGMIWYTTDGNDPRLPAGDSPGTSTTLVAEDDAKRVLIPTSDIGDTWRGGQPFDDSGWNHGTPIIPGKTGGVGYDEETTYNPYITYDVEAQMNDLYTTCYIRIPFTVDACDLNSFNFMTLKIRYDDGFVAYLNGDPNELAKRNFTGTPSWDSGANSTHDDSAAVNFENIPVSAYISALQQGDNILAIHGLNYGASSSDFLISVELVAGEIDPSGISPSAIEYIPPTPVTLTESIHIKARVLDGITWSALNEATFAVGPVTDNLRITEMMYHPLDTNSPDDPNAEYIELTNIGPETINLSLVSFTEGIHYTFPPLELASGEFVLLVKDQT
ncbi:MAG: CotH kinase family protein, partial [Planctomycetota bacterium]